MARLIGVYANAMGSGKSSVAEILHERDYINIPFAAPLKETARALLLQAGYDELEAQRLLYTPEGKQEVLTRLGDITTRKLLQDLGSWGRKVVPGGIWLNLWRERVRGLFQMAALAGNEHVGICVDDLRYPDEMRAVYELGGWTLQVIRPGVEITEEHESERDWGLDPTPGSGGKDWKVVNDSSLEELRKRVLAVLDQEDRVESPRR